jgi:hypothetical protein
MSNSFFAYLQQLELMAFFSGYPLLYAVIIFITGNQQLKNNLKNRLVSFLPLSYALVGSLYLGFQLNKFYSGYSVENIKQTIHHPWLTTWALLSILFWIPAIGKKTFLSLIHSLVFFLFLARDLMVQLFLPTADVNVVRNDMKLYTDSILLNLGAFVFIMLINFLFRVNKKRLTP